MISGAERHAWRRRGRAGTLLALSCCAVPVLGAEWDLGGDVRYFQFLALENISGRREDAELGALRLKARSDFADALSFEVHGLLQGASPANASGTSIATATTRHYLDLETDIERDRNLLVSAEFDRLTLSIDRPAYRITIGRQAITWGVNYFWPSIDLFAPFAPERIDRDYKPGVDAARLIIPTGDFAEWDIVLAGQGEDFSDDFSLAALRRWNADVSDFGLMAGRFHTDTVIGGFLVTEAWATGWRAEIAYTDSGDPEDAAIGREDFWRASLGVDRLINEDLTLVAEVAWNGFGREDPASYAQIAASDRFLRGEVNALARWYVGASLNWQAHPLLIVSTPLIANLDDGSVLLQPSGAWSLGDNSTLQFGLLVGLGPGLDRDGTPGSEYGAAPLTLWAAIKYYF